MMFRSLRLMMSLTALTAVAAATGCNGNRCGSTMMSADAPSARGNAAPPQNAGTAEPSNAAAATRAVEEADIIQVDGGRLYAMSRVSGLSVVDISSTTQLSLLGAQKIAGVPFEMYRRGDVLLAMANNAVDGGGNELATQPPSGQAEAGMMMPNGMPAPSTLPYSAKVFAIDVRDPAQMKKLASFEVPGEIADSRTVGDVLYVVSYENGQCWKCSGTPRTVVTSFNVANPTQMKQVDQVSFTSDLLEYPAWKRSVAATASRLYVAGVEYSWTSSGQGAQSTIDVLDITDPTGKLGVGAKILVKGQILSRWQMDEHDGVLRVISQRDIAVTRNGSGAPFVDTFKIQDSKTITPLGATTIKLPIQEALKSVRFDGTRAYAITFRNTDPLFTLDLSNPALPVQKGELEIPGFVHHIEPRGDRLVALGVESSATSGQLNVSLFDVSDMTKPTMLSRVAFGSYGGLTDLTEDQNRIHKAFRIFDDHGLVAVPHTSRYQMNYGSTTCDPSSGNIQLIDLGRNTLQLRARLDIPGTPRRALIDQGRLLAVSETNIRSFSLASRISPVQTADLSIAQCSLSPNGYPNGYDGRYDGYGRGDYEGGWSGDICE